MELVRVVQECPSRRLAPFLRRPGGGAGKKGEEPGVVAELNRRVRAEGPVVVAFAGPLAGGLPVHEDAPEVRSPDLALQPRHAVVVRRQHKPAGLRIERRLRLHVHEPDVVGAHLSGEPGAAQDPDRLAGNESDPPAEEEVHLLRRSELEGRGVLQEEGPLFREEERKPGEVDLLVVRLDLGEVGVRGHVHGEIRRHTPFHIQSDVEPLGRPRLVADGEVVPRGVAEREGGDLDVPPSGKLQPADLAGQRDPVDVVAPGDRREERLFVLAADVPHHVEPPGAVGARLVAERPQRDGELGLPAPLGSLGADGPVAVPVRVEAGDAAPLRSALARARVVAAGDALPGDLAVVLDPLRIRPEQESVLVVVEGVKDHLDRIRLVQVPVAPALGDKHRLRIAVERDDADVEGRVREQQPDLGPLRRRGAVVRLLLGEAGKRKSGDPLLVGDQAVHDRPFDPFAKPLHGPFRIRRSTLGGKSSEPQQHKGRSHGIRHETTHGQHFHRNVSYEHS